MNLTVALLKTIGSPFIPQSDFKISTQEKYKLFDYAFLNKIPLLYLNTLKNKKQLDGLEAVYKKIYHRHLMFLSVMADLDRILEEAKIEYTIFKTIKPYPHESSDIDILILNNQDFEKAVKALRKKWIIKGFGPQSITFYDAHADLGIDLHREIAVSYITYIDKALLRNFLITEKLPNNKNVVTLCPAADLAIISLHSAIKEQLYTLAEYCTLIYNLAEMTEKDIRLLVQVARENACLQALKPFVALTCTLHTNIYGTIPRVLKNVAAAVDAYSIETKTFLKNKMRLPHKYGLPTVMKAFFEKAKNRKTKKALAIQLFHMFKPSFSRNILRDILDHSMRETY